MQAIIKSAANQPSIHTSRVFSSAKTAPADINPSSAECTWLRVSFVIATSLVIVVRPRFFSARRTLSMCKGRGGRSVLENLRRITPSVGRHAGLAYPMLLIYTAWAILWITYQLINVLKLCGLFGARIPGLNSRFAVRFIAEATDIGCTFVRCPAPQTLSFHRGKRSYSSTAAFGTVTPTARKPGCRKAVLNFGVPSRH